jgi:hypothetical protein
MHEMNSPRLLRRDIWIQRYLAYVFLETKALSGGQIAEHYLKCARAAYVEFVVRGKPEDRYRCWLAIRTACQWLCQLRRTK